MSDLDVLCELRTDAPSLWQLLGECRVDDAIVAAHHWLGSESHPAAALGVKVGLAVAHLLAGNADGAWVIAEGALDDALTDDLREYLGFLGVALRSTSGPLERGDLATLAAGVFRRLARTRRADGWVKRWARFQFHFGRLLLRNRLPAASIAAFAELPRRLVRVTGLRPHDPDLASLLARSMLHTTQANVLLARTEHEVAAAIAIRTAIDGFRALHAHGLAPHRFDAALAVADIHLALRSPPWQVEPWTRAAERLASGPAEHLRALARRGAVTVRDDTGREAFLRAAWSWPSAADDNAHSSPESVGAIVQVCASALELGEFALARAWIEIAGPGRSEAPSDLLASLDALEAELATRDMSEASKAEQVHSRTRAAFDRMHASLRSSRRVTPAWLDGLGRLAYALVTQHLARREAGQALLVLEHARALRLLAAQPLEAQLAPPPTLPALPHHVLGLVFLWDNRNERLGAFSVTGDSPAFGWLERSADLTHQLIEAFEEVRRGRARCEPVASWLRDRVLAAPTSTGASLAELIGAPRTRRVIVVPHGPLAGLPLHAAIALLRPDVTVSYATQLCPEPPIRPAVSERATFCSLVDPSDTEDRLLFRSERTTCRRILEGAGLTSAEATVAADVHIPRGGLLHVATHGTPVGAVPEVRPSHPVADPWRAAYLELRDGAGRLVRWTSRAILRAAPVRIDIVLLGCCETVRATNPSLMPLGPANPGVSWRVPFLEDSSHGIVGAFLAAGAGEIFAYPHSVYARCPHAFFPALLGHYAAGRARGCAAEPGDYDWATAAAAVLRELAATEMDPRVLEELPLIQHWISPSVLTRRDSHGGSQ